MPNWTERDISDQTGRVIIVTGANSGLGFETARALVDKGATVIVACRNEAKGQEAAREMPGPGSAIVMKLDLASLASIQAFSNAVAQRFESVDVLVNNAGVMAIPRTLTEDGFEMQLGTNHLGHFALTARLMPLLEKAADGARVVTVSSATHWVGKIAFDDLMGERRYNEWIAYGQSKLANLLFMLELSRRLRNAKKPIVATGAHPGYAGTNLQRRGPEARGSTGGLKFWDAMNKVFSQSAKTGALPTLYAATAHDVDQGEYFGPRFLEIYGAPARAWRSPSARNEADASRLWRESERLVGLTFSA